MAPPRRRTATLSFETITIEGGLLSAEWLARVAQLGADAQAEKNYRIPKGLNLRDEIARYWRIAQAHWADFEKGRASGADQRALATVFVESLLHDSLGFSSLAAIEAPSIAGRLYPVSHAALAGRVPVVIAPAAFGLDTPSAVFGDGTRRRTAFGLLQEYLNAADESRWGLACDGVTLRLARDNASLTRPAWIEADLARIFAEERYADFAALWLLAHESRFDYGGGSLDDSPIERWRTAGLEEGTRARDQLRRGVEEALVALGQGFLSHPENQALAQALRDGSLTRTAYFQELLRLVYRLIFLLTIEERGVLHPEGTSDAVRALYAEGYSMRRLRDRAVRRSAHDRFGDLWETTKIVFRGLATGEPRLGLPALAGLFGTGQCPTLDASKLANKDLLLAVFRLAWLRDKSGLVRVNWRDMGPEELGSVYESLLELVPQITTDGRQFTFASGGEAKGHARKTTGSYYTPDSLVQVLLDSALEPVIADTIAAHPQDPVPALLQLSIVDPACGSGHFILAAARRLASHVARFTASATPSAAEYRHALRQVVGRCIYGVDLNPMAVELCKVSLWMEAVEPGLPLTFLDSHIQCGNALLGTTPELMEKGIPDEAWEPIEGDDRKVASALKKRNKSERSGQLALGFGAPDASTAEQTAVVNAVAELDRASDIDVEALRQKEAQWAALQASDAYQHQKLVADAWCAAFVWPKQEQGPVADAAPTTAVWRALRDNTPLPSAPLLRQVVTRLAQDYSFFHWHLAFPQVFARGGFDVVLGNPPWERVKLQEQEFFASRSEEIAGALNAAARKKLIAKLPETDPQLWQEWCAALRASDGQTHLMRNSGRYPLCGKGDINTYAVFAEHTRSITRPGGRAGFIVPSGIVTDDTTKEYFQSLVDGSQLASVFHFENEERVFPGVHHATRFVLLTVDKSGRSERADLVFYARRVSDLKDPARRFSLAPTDFGLLNPNTRTCPTFRSQRDAEISLAIYRRAGVLWKEGDPDGNPWQLSFMAMLHMANDSGLFKTREELEGAGLRLVGNRFEGPGETWLPLIEAKMVHHFDHRFGTYEGQSTAQENQGKLPELDDEAHDDPFRSVLPRYWVSASDVESTLPGDWSQAWFFAWRAICRSSDRRTVIATVLPRHAVGHTLLLALPHADHTLIACFCANLSAFVLDYCSRQKIGGSSLTFFILRQLPVLPPRCFAPTLPWSGMPVRQWLLPRVLELTYTAWDLEPFARDVGYDGPPFRWDPERRFLLRAELDAAFFHLYGLSRDDVDYVMDTFPIVRKNDERAHGEYRTKRVILEIYDEMAAAARTGVPYATRLDPPPADPRVAHPPRHGLAVPARVPTLVPEMEASLHAAWVVVAIVQASGGAVATLDLLRAFTLWRAPELLVRFASPDLRERAEEWASRVKDRHSLPGLVPTLSELAARRAIERFVDADGRSVVSTGVPLLTNEWHQFEAALALTVARSIPHANWDAINQSLPAADQALLAEAV